MAYLISSQRIRQSIDIGVYRGRSFFPQAWAHTKYTKGKVIGIDPYSSADAMEHDQPELEAAIKEFVDVTDFDDIYSTVDGLRSRLDVAAGSELLRMRSNDAVAQLADQRFGLIHVDGNHDRGAALGDVTDYLPLLDAKNGFLIIDDISWASVRPAVDFVTARMTLLYARVDTFNDYAVFWNGTSPTKKSRLRKAIALAGEG